MHFKSIAAAAAVASTASAQTYQGFNYGSSFTSGSPKQAQDFHDEFTTAQNLIGHKGFNSARLYTMIQAGTDSTPISAIQAAIDTKTTLLLGLWGSAGQASIDKEINALKAAIQQYGSAFTDLIAGISVGSEDLYRITPTGIQNKAGVGAGPDDITSYIKQVRQAISGTPASKAPVGHVDTWTAWVNGSNSEVIRNCDWLGVDSYPYFQTVDANGIENGAELFFEAYRNTTDAAQGKPVWITETGWPVSGAPSAQAIASVDNAKRYWNDVACKVLGTTSTWWYTLQDAEPDTPSPSFGLVAGPKLSTTPVFDLSCSNTNSTTGSNTTGGSGSTGSSGSTGGSGSTGSGSSGSGSGAPGSTGSSGSGSSSSTSSSGSGSQGSSSSGATGGSSGSSSSSSNGAPSSYGSSSSGSSGNSGSAGSSGSTGSTGSSGSSGSAGSAGSSGSTGSTGSSGSTGSTGSSSSNGSTSPYSSSYGSASKTNGTSSGSSYGGSKTTPSPAAYTGAAVVNKPAIAAVAGAFGLAALFA